MYREEVDQLIDQSCIHAFSNPKRAAKTAMQSKGCRRVSFRVANRQTPKNHRIQPIRSGPQ